MPNLSRELMVRPCRQRNADPQDGALLPAFASMAARRSLLSFRSWASLVRRASFRRSSSSSWLCSRLASASTRFLPYLYWSASETRSSGEAVSLRTRGNFPAPLLGSCPPVLAR